MTTIAATPAGAATPARNATRTSPGAEPTGSISIWPPTSATSSGGAATVMVTGPRRAVERRHRPRRRRSATNTAAAATIAELTIVVRAPDVTSFDLSGNNT